MHQSTSGMDCQVRCIRHFHHIHKIIRQTHKTNSRLESKLATPNARPFLCLKGRKRHQVTVQAVDRVLTSLHQLQGGAEGIGAFLETAPPPCYLIYLLAAGVGLPCSEDALVAWVGSNMAKNVYGTAYQNAMVLAIVYVGVVTSDMITFGMGVLLKWGFLKRVKDSLMRDPARFERAIAMVRQWSRLIGFVQRFSLGFRGPLCLVCGFTDVPASQFLAGIALGALATIPLQLCLGYMLRDAASPYFAALAIAAGPNLVGHIIGPMATALGFVWSSRKSVNKQGTQDPPPAPP